MVHGLLLRRDWPETAKNVTRIATIKRTKIIHKLFISNNLQ